MVSTPMSRTQRLRDKIEQIRKRIGDDPNLHPNRIRYKSKRVSKNTKSNMEIKQKKATIPHRQMSPEQKKYVLDNKLRINGLCAEICRNIKWAKELPFDDREQAYNNIKKRISNLIADNKKTFNYDRYKTFSEEEITKTSKCNASELFREAIDNGDIRYDEDLPGYVDADDIPINEYDFKFSNCCRELAKVSLLRGGGLFRRTGYDCDARISHVEGCFKELEQCVIVRRRFRQSVINNAHNSIAVNSDSSQHPLSSFIVKDSDKVITFIDNELKSCNKKQGKLIAMIIITLCEEGYFVQYKGKLTTIHKAFSDLYPNKIAGFSVIVDYINGYYKPSDSNTKRIPDYELTQLRNKIK